MATFPIRTFGDPVLREKARAVESVSDLHRRLIDDMFETMRAAGNGVGLAANQIGVLDRIFVWEYEDEHGAFVDPVILDRSEEEEEADEGCLSIPGLNYPVWRATSVTVEGLDPAGRSHKVEASGFLARIFQHEIDHLDGVLFIDRLDEDRRREAMRILRDQALGLVPAPPVPEVAAEERL